MDLPRLASLAKKHGLITLVDGTLATPCNLQPINFGVDMVVHGVTEYLSGHNDITVGMVGGSKEFIQKLKKTRKILGGALDPIAA